MRKLTAALFCCALLATGHARAADAPATTVTGIPLDAPWKVKIYAFAREHFHHPSWGYQHSERDYLLAMQFAKEDGIKADPDVLFAAAMMHDMAAFKPWDADMKGGKIEHGDVAAADCPPILRDAGFPMEKIAAVQAAESGHMYYSKATLPEAQLLHDADSVDFLGAIGAARIIATVGEDRPSMSGAIKTLRSFLKDIPPALYTNAAKKAAAPRIAELKAFLAELDAEDDDGKGI
jgi:uncharacterized protein